MQVTIGNNSKLISQARWIRHQVFVLEQQIPLALVLDGLDENSSHAMVTDDNALVATARLTVGDNDHAVMARISVVKKIQGLWCSINCYRNHVAVRA